MTRFYFSRYCGIHFFNAVRFTRVTGAADDLIERGGGNRFDRPQQHTIHGIFDGEFDPGAPLFGLAYRHRQDNLTFTGQPGGFHKTSAIKYKVR